MTFKERVAQVAIAQAPVYRSVFVEYEYLICSKAFRTNGYYILSALETNYLHLIGVNPLSLTPKGFYDKCISGTLTDTDFDFRKPGHTEAEIKGSVRRKIKVLPSFVSMFGKDLIAQESFSRNKVICSFATTDCNMTVGFIDHGKARPRSLMAGDMIDWSIAEPVDLIFRKSREAAQFSDMIFGEVQMIAAYRPQIDGLLHLTS